MFKFKRIFDRSISGSILKQLLWLVVFVLIVFLFWLGLSYLLFDSSSIDAVKTDDGTMSGLNNAIKKRYWGILSHLFDPGNLHMASPKLRIFTLLIAFSGSVLLSGLLISTFSNSLERRIDKIKTGQINYNFRNHYIIMGYNDMVPSLIMQLSGRKNKMEEMDIILHTSQYVPDVRRKIKTRLSNKEEALVTILQGGRDTLEQMERLRVHRSREIFIMGESGDEIIDTPNVECLNLITEVLIEKKTKAKSKKARNKPRIPCHVLIHSQSTYSALQFMNLHDDVRKVIDFLPNNFHELWARQVLVYNQAHTSPSGGETIKYKALDYQTIQENSPLEVHLIIVGFSRMGVALAVEAIRVAHFANGKKTRITIIDKTATTERDYFRTRFPYFEKINEIDINFIEGGIETEDIRQKLFKWTLEKNVLPTIAICFNHPNKCLSSALTLPLGVYETETPILVQQEISYSMISLLNKNQDNFNKFKNVLPFGMTDQCFKIDRDRDLMAKAVSFFYHKDYSFNENVNTSDMEVYWKESQLINKWSNRYNADSFNFKIRALGLPSIDFKQPKKIKIREFEDSEIEILAKMEHARWNAERILAGYQPPSKSQMNESKDMELKAFKSHKSGLQKKMVHLCIVPYNQLREYYRDIDRKLVKAIPAILKLYSNEL